VKVLALTTRRRLTAEAVREYRREMDLGPDTVIELVGVQPLDGDLPVRRVDAVDPSVVPFRPVVPVRGPGLLDWRGLRKHYTRLLRAGRRATGSLPRPARRNNQTYLAVAAATSAALRARAADADVVVALDPRAALAAWHLARRVEGPAVVEGAENVRLVLERMGRTVPLHQVPDDQAPSETSGIEGTPLPELPSAVRDRPHSIVIAPGNYAGQGRAWARAVRDHCGAVGAMNVRVGVQKTVFPTDYFVGGEAFNGDLEWRIAWRDLVERHFSHVVVEANLPILGGGLVGAGERNVRELQRAGKTVALLSHGSDARVPSIHAERERWHSYDALAPSFLHRLETQARLNADAYNDFDGTVFVSTPGVRAFVPRALWLPVVVDTAAWANDVPLLGHKVPVVAHVPSSSQKGSHMIDPILTGMAERGLIEYLRVSGVPHEEMPGVVASADLLVEQFGIADYSVASCEAMAAGRVVVSRVADEVRDAVRDETGLDLPIVEANPETLEQVVLDLLADSDRARSLADRGLEFVKAVHDGRRSAQVLGRWVHETAGATP
jgi:hypothetical protein